MNVRKNGRFYSKIQSKKGITYQCVNTACVTPTFNSLPTATSIHVARHAEATWCFLGGKQPTNNVLPLSSLFILSILLSIG